MPKAKPQPQLGFGEAWAWCGFDTETSGLPDPDKSIVDAAQPRVAAVALVRCTPGFAITRQQLLYVKRDGWNMHPEATAVNGITDAFLDKHGIPIEEVLDQYEAVIREGRALIGHNVGFDLRMMRGELRRAGRDDRFDTTLHVCTMQMSFGVVRAKTAEGKAKPATLEELMRHLKIPQHGPHTAAGDGLSVVQAAKRMSEFGIALTPKTLKRRPANEKGPF